jgi:hypothetical protein
MDQGGKARSRVVALWAATKWPILLTSQSGLGRISRPFTAGSSPWLRRERLVT